MQGYARYTWPAICGKAPRKAVLPGSNATPLTQCSAQLQPYVPKLPRSCLAGMLHRDQRGLSRQCCWWGRDRYRAWSTIAVRSRKYESKLLTPPTCTLELKNYSSIIANQLLVRSRILCLNENISIPFRVLRLEGLSGQRYLARRQHCLCGLLTGDFGQFPRFPRFMGRCYRKEPDCLSLLRLPSMS